jgi:hypothetical protein
MAAPGSPGMRETMDSLLKRSSVLVLIKGGLLCSDMVDLFPVSLSDRNESTFWLQRTTTISRFSKRSRTHTDYSALLCFGK